MNLPYKKSGPKYKKRCAKGDVCRALGLSELLFAFLPSQLLEFQELKSTYDALYQRQQQMTEVRELW